MKKRVKHALEGSERDFFYDLLAKYESESNHKGYNYSRVDKGLQAKVNLECKKKVPVNKPKDMNTFYFTGNSKSADFLRHIRNAFAHCNIYSNDNMATFSIYDEHQGKCTMDGSMNKADLYKLIKEIYKTRT